MFHSRSAAPHLPTVLGSGDNGKLGIWWRAMCLLPISCLDGDGIASRQLTSKWDGNPILDTRHSAVAATGPGADRGASEGSHGSSGAGDGRAYPPDGVHCPWYLDNPEPPGVQRKGKCKVMGPYPSKLWASSDTPWSVKRDRDMRRDESAGGKKQGREWERRSRGGQVREGVRELQR